MPGQLKPAVNERDHAEGNAGAPIVLVEFGDYQCPYCGAAYPVIKKIQQTFGDQVRFVFRNFPLSEIHPDAMQAAIASEAAALQNKFWQMHDIIFENQSALSKHGLEKMAEKIGLDINKFITDMEDENLLAKVEEDFESGMRSGVNGTPTFFVNGKKFDGGATDLFELFEENA